MVYVVVKVKKERLEELCKDIAEVTKEFGVWSEVEAQEILRTLPDNNF